MMKAIWVGEVIPLDVYSGMLSEDKKEPPMLRIKGPNFQDRGNSKFKGRDELSIVK